MSSTSAGIVINFSKITPEGTAHDSDDGLPSQVPGSYRMIGSPGSCTMAFWVHSGTVWPLASFFATVSTTVIAVMRGVLVSSPSCVQLRA